MTCKFKQIKEFPGDCYEIHFNVNGKDNYIFVDGLENMMLDVLNDNEDKPGSSEWLRWCEDGTLPETFGHVENDHDQGDLEYAEKYYTANSKDYQTYFEE